MGKALKDSDATQTGLLKKSIKKPAKPSKLELAKQMIKKRKSEVTNGKETEPTPTKKTNKKKRSPKDQIVEETPLPTTEDMEPEEDAAEDDGVGEDVDMQDEEEEVNEQVEEQIEEPQANRGPTLCKILKPTFELDAFYTGGKIEIGHSEKTFYAICNFTIAVYNFEQKIVTNTIKQENEDIANFAVAPDEKTLVYFTKNNLMRHVNIADNSQLRIWKLHDLFALSMEIDKTGVLLAIGTTNGIIQVYDLRKGHITHNFTNNRGPIQSLRFHPNPQKLLLISTCEDLTIKLYDLVISSCVQTFQDFEATISDVTLLNKGMSLISSSYDKFIKLFDLKTMKKLTQLPVDEEIHAIQSVSIKKKDGSAVSVLVMGGDNGVLKTLDLADAKAKIIEHPYIVSHTIRNIMHLQKEKKILVVNEDQNLILLKYAFDDQGKVVFTIDSQMTAYNDEVIDAKFVKTHNYKDSDFKAEHIVFATNNEHIRVLTPATRQIDFLVGHKDIVMSIDTYGPFVVSGSKDNTIRLWYCDPSQQKFLPIATFEGHTGSVGSVYLAPHKGHRILSGSVDKSIKVWDIQRLCKNALENENTAHVTISQALRTTIPHEKDINCVRFSPNDKLVASASQDRLIKIFEAETLKPTMILRGHKRGVWDISFSKFEKLLASASGDKTVKVWNLVDGSCIHTFEGHENAVLKVDWICYGLELVTAGADNLIKLWNIKKMTCINTFEKHEGRIWSLDSKEAANGDALKIISGGNDSLLCIWEDMTLDDELENKKVEGEKVQSQQRLRNLMRDKNFLEAGKLSFDINFIQAFKQVLEGIVLMIHQSTDILFEESTDIDLDKAEGEAKGEQTLKDLIDHCIEKDLGRIILLTRDLNSTAKYSGVAQKILKYIISKVDLTDLDAFVDKFKLAEKDKKIEEIFEILLSYSERHLERIRKYMKKSHYLDYILKSCNAILPEQQE